MTDEERDAVLRTIAERQDEMHRRLFEDGPANEPPMIDRLAKMLVAFENSGRVSRALIKGFLGLGAIAGAAAAIWKIIAPDNGGQ